MTRTQNVTKLRKAGFKVQPRYEAQEPPALKLSCYTLRDAQGLYLTDMIVEEVGTLLTTFFESPSLRVSDDIAHLRDLAKQVAGRSGLLA